MIEQTGFLLPIASWVLFASLKSIAIIPLVLLMRRLFARWLTPQARYGLWFAVIACLAIPFGAQVELRSTPQAVVAPEDVRAASQSNAGSNEAPVIGISTAPAARSFRPSAQTVAITVWLLGVTVLAVAVLRNAARYSRMSATASEPDAATAELFQDCRQVVKIRRHVRLFETSGVDSPVLVGYWQPTLLLPPNLSSQVSREQLRLVLLHELTHVGRHDVLANWLITCVQIAHWFNPLAWYALRIARNDMEQACDASVLRHLTTTEQYEYGNTLIRLSDITPQRALLVQNASVVESRSQLKARINMIARFKPLGTASSMLGATLIALASIVACTQGADAPQQPARPAAQLTTTATVEQTPLIPAVAALEEPKPEVGTEAPKPMPAAVKQAGGAPVLEATYLKVKYAKAKDLVALMKSPDGIDLLSAAGSIAIDERTNTLLVKDSRDNVAAIRELVASLDLPVEQLYLSGQFAMLDEDLIQELRTSAPGDTRALPAISLGTDGSAVAMLEAGVRANRAEVVSAPRWIMANRVKTSIQQTVDLPLQPGKAPNPLARKMHLNLGLTPTLRPDSRIVLDVDANVDRLGTVVVTTGGQAVPSIDTTRTTTQVLLDSGATVMLDLAEQFAPDTARDGTSGQRRRLVAFVTLTRLAGN